MHVDCKTANLFKQKVYQDFVSMKKKTSTTHDNYSSKEK